MRIPNFGSPNPIADVQRRRDYRAGLVGMATAFLAETALREMSHANGFGMCGNGGKRTEAQRVRRKTCTRSPVGSRVGFAGLNPSYVQSTS